MMDDYFLPCASETPAANILKSYVYIPLLIYAEIYSPILFVLLDCRSAAPDIQLALVVVHVLWQCPQAGPLKLDKYVLDWSPP